MPPRGELIQTPVPESEWARMFPAYGLLLGYVRTDVPGFRELYFDNGASPGGIYVASPGEYRVDDLSYPDYPEGIIWNDGRWEFDEGSSSLRFPDRLGWLLGMVAEAGEAPIANLARFVSPAAIPLLGFTWTKVTSDADRRERLDRHKKNQGYAWGAATLISCRLTMTRYALEALQVGYCQRGKVTVGTTAKINTPLSASDPQGAITGYVLGVDSTSWLEPAIQQTAVVDMTIVMP